MGFTVPNVASAASARQAEIDSVDFDIINAAQNGTAVISGCGATTAGTFTVVIGAGVVMISGVRIAVPGNSVTVSAADGTHPRSDIIAINTAGTASVTAGTPAADPVYPLVPASSCAIWGVDIPTGAVALNAGQLTDKRVFVPAGNTYTISPASVGDQTAAIAAALAAIPDGTHAIPTIVNFVAPADFTVDGRIILASRNHMVINGAAGRQITSHNTFPSGTDGSSTLGSTTYTSASADWNATYDVGLTITGTNIPAGTTIAAVTNSTTIVLSQAATATGTGLSWSCPTRDRQSHFNIYQCTDITVNNWSIRGPAVASVGPGNLYVPYGLSGDNGHAYAIASSTKSVLNNCVDTLVWGDHVYIGGNNSLGPNTGIVVNNHSGDGGGRHGLGIVHTSGATISGSFLHSGYTAVDAEPYTAAGQAVSNLDISGTFSALRYGFSAGGTAVTNIRLHDITYAYLPGNYWLIFVVPSDATRGSGFIMQHCNCLHTDSIPNTGSAAVTIQQEDGDVIITDNQFAVATSQASIFQFVGTGGTVVVRGNTNTTKVLPITYSTPTGGQLDTDMIRGLSGAMSAGAVTVTEPLVTAASRILVSRQPGGTNPGAPWVDSITAGTSFVVKSTNAADTGVVAYQIVEPA